MVNANINIIHGGKTALFGIPPLPNTALQLDMDSRFNVTKDMSNKVSAWTGNSINAVPFQQLTGANQPTWVDAVINNHPVIRFSGVNQFLRTTLNQTLNLSNKMDVFVVFAIDNTVGTKSIISRWDTGGNNASWAVQIVSDELAMNLATAPAINNLQETTFYNLPINTFRVHRYSYDGTQAANDDRVKMYNKETLLTDSETGTIPATINNPAINIHIGVLGPSLANDMDGDIARILVYNQIQTGTALNDIITNLSMTYGI